MNTKRFFAHLGINKSYLGVGFVCSVKAKKYVQTYVQKISGYLCALYWIWIYFSSALYMSRYTRFSLNLVSRQIEDFTTQIASLFFVVTFHGRYQLISSPSEENFQANQLHVKNVT